MTTTETMLDELYALQAKRAANIQGAGADFTLAGTERTCKGLLDAKAGTVQFLPSTPLCYGAIFESKGIRYFVTGTEAKAGCTVAHVAAISGTAQVLRKQAGPNGETLATDTMELPILGKSGNEITVPKYAAASVGKILKCSGSLLEVVGARIDGATAVLQVREYHPDAPATPQRHAAPPRMANLQDTTRYWSAGGL